MIKQQIHSYKFDNNWSQSSVHKANGSQIPNTLSTETDAGINIVDHQYFFDSLKLQDKDNHFFYLLCLLECTFLSLCRSFMVMHSMIKQKKKNPK